MYLDMHSHSVSSDDSRATVEQYVKWIQVLRKRGHTIDGIVLTEHRKFDIDKDYSDLAAQYNVLVLKGSELDTRFGHFLVYGVRAHRPNGGASLSPPQSPESQALGLLGRAPGALPGPLAGLPLVRDLR